MKADKQMRISAFTEKPARASQLRGMAVSVGGKRQYLASMGIYLFNKDLLFELLQDTKKVDFGREVIPQAIARHRSFAFIHEGYWKDIGSIKAFYEENLAFTDPEPPIDLFDENWPFFTRPRYLPLSRVSDTQVTNSNIAEGAVIEAKRISHSVVGLRSRIGRGTVIEDSIVMGNDFYVKGHPSGNAPMLGIGKNCLIRKTIVDKNVRIGDNVKIINERGLTDFENEYCVIHSGITIIPKNTVVPSGTVI
jgi:glucose-1-phosphate adenylyltransferase